MSSYREATRSYTTLMMVRDLATRVAPYSRTFVLATFIRIIGDLAWLYPALAVATIITELARGAGASSAMIGTAFLWWGVAIVVRAVARSWSSYLGFHISERARLDTEHNALAHLTALDMAWHESESSGAKMKRVTAAAQSVDKVIRMWFTLLVSIVVTVFGVSIILSRIDPWLTALIAVFASIYFPLAFLLGRRAAARSLAVQKEEEYATGFMYETIANVRTVQVFDHARAALERLEGALRAVAQQVGLRIAAYQVRSLILFLCAQGFLIVTLVIVVLGIMSGTYEIGLFALAYRFFGQVWDAAGELAEFSQEFMSAKLALARLSEMTHATPQGLSAECVDMPLNWKTIRFDDVSFSYGDTVALSHVSFTMLRGQKVGIVGSSGAGKSTLFKLLLKERHTYTGEIYIDDIPLRTIRRASYFRRVSAVLQDTEIFNISLADNVRLARPDAQEKDALTNALRTAHVVDFAERLPQGVDTVIGERGVKLSGGERQRVGIARAIYKEPDLLLMDEATSHLDSDSEERIQDSLTRFFSRVTALVIAHRLSTIRAMDLILVVEGGRVVEQGSFDQLVAHGGRFAELWTKQMV